MELDGADIYSILFLLSHTDLIRDLCFVLSAIDDVNRRVSVLRLLVSLLPPANRDTLWTLLSFLGVLVKHSDDTVDENGQQVERCAACC